MDYERQKTKETENERVTDGEQNMKGRGEENEKRNITGDRNR